MKYEVCGAPVNEEESLEAPAGTVIGHRVYRSNQPRPPTQLIQQLLSDGWEPFSTSEGIMWFRREVETV